MNSNKELTLTDSSLQKLKPQLSFQLSLKVIFKKKKSN